MREVSGPRHVGDRVLVRYTVRSVVDHAVRLLDLPRVVAVDGARAWLVSPPATGVINPGDEVSFTIGFEVADAAAGHVTAEVLVLTDDLAQPVYTFSMGLLTAGSPMPRRLTSQGCGAASGSWQGQRFHVSYVVALGLVAMAVVGRSRRSRWMVRGGWRCMVSG